MVAILLATSAVVLLLAARGRAEDEAAAAEIREHLGDALSDHMGASLGRLQDLATVIG